ncbi:hypothetical protein D9M72_426600 [compost metagenome]
MASSSPTTKAPTPAVVSSSPTQSRRRDWSPAPWGTRRRAAMNAARPNGTLIRKIQCHDRNVVSAPPTSGARTGASSPGHTRYAVARSRSSLGVRRSTTRVPTGTIIAPPAPCRTRLTVSMVRSWLRAHNSEAMVNTAMAAQKTRRAPTRSASQPLTGIPMATVMR